MLVVVLERLKKTPLLETILPGARNWSESSYFQGFLELCEISRAIGSDHDHLEELYTTDSWAIKFRLDCNHVALCEYVVAFVA